ncbi:M48 family metallopeptidase [Sandarakinorhabdus oryzae]|uniref:M48 family metallopeptidase n=1 Tax=Sandarakinorhabdus oryzae TaxID=2675220 RepID=UPI0012E30882|nr:M48 family metallopeptidase [Sandarakinorhabdus oryzae]
MNPLPPDQIKGRLFDGQTARARAVVLDVGGDTLLLIGMEEMVTLDWRRLQRGRDGLSLTDPARPDWRLRLDEPLPAPWQARLAIEGAVTGDDRRRLFMAGAGVVAVGLVLWFGGTAVLNAVAHRLPRAWMAPIGVGIVEGLGHQCHTPAGDAAAAALMARLQSANPAEKVRLTIIDAPVVNAMALPGGQVVIFDQLIREAQSPDELAGVLAHELSHIKARDSERALVRQLGLSLLLQSVGGNIAGGADTLLMLSSSREAEAAADDGAIALLRGARVATAPTADFFDRQLGKERPKGKAPAKPSSDLDKAAERLSRLADITASHPDSGSRSRLFKTAAAAGPVTPALAAAQWQALKGMCVAGRDKPAKVSAPPDKR